MSREIKFRGKLMEGADTWVYGSLINNTFQMNDKTPILYIFDHNSFGYFDCWEDIAERIDEFRVIPESVGMFTGLKDKNGKDIYEGDIVKYWYSRDASGTDVSEFTETIQWNQEGDMYGFGFLSEMNPEIIGNKYEHPHLLQKQ